jgi:PAS domain S-box-containing protein
MSNSRDFYNTTRIDIPPSLLHSMDAMRKQRPASLQTSDESIPQPFDDNSTPNAFSQFLQSAYDGILIIDMTGRVVESNDRARHFLLYHSKELHQKKIHEIISGSDTGLVDIVRHSLDNKRFVLIQAYCVCKDGSTFPAEISINLLKFQDMRLCMFIRDITVRKQSEELLKTCYKAINNAGNGIAVADKTGRLVYINPAVLRMWNFPDAAAIIGKNIRELWVDSEQVDAMIGSVIEQQQHWTGEIVALTADSRQIVMQISAACNRDSDDQLMGMVLSFTDISDRKLVEDARRQAEATSAMSASVGAACHHIGQPATVLLGNLDLMRQMLQDNPDEELKSMVNECFDAADMLGKILYKLKRISVYKTVNYLQSKDHGGASDNQILDLECVE